MLDTAMTELTFARVWAPLIYLYGVGGLFFLGGMILSTRSKSLDRRTKDGKMWFRILLFGYGWYLFIHTSLTLAALYLK